MSGGLESRLLVLNSVYKTRQDLQKRVARKVEERLPTRDRSALSNALAC